MLFSQILARKEMYYSEYLGETVVDLLGKSFDVPDSYRCDIAPLDSGYTARPDLISDEVYSDDMYADLIVKLNGPGNPFEVNDKQYVIIPAADNLDKFVNVPSKEWSETYLTSQASKPKAKARNEKRKPNEAVIGDKRFNIDAQSKVIIY